MYEIIIKFVVGLLILLFSTQKLVKLAEIFSQIFRLSPLVVGVTVVAVGTSIPELTVSLISILQGDSGLAMGNIIGSNIINILLVFPIALFIGKLRIGTTKTQRNSIFLLLATVLFVVTQFSGMSSLTSGILLIGSAILFTIIEIKLAIYGRKHEDAKQFKTRRVDRFSLRTLLFGIILILGIIVGGILVVSTVEQISVITGISTTILGLTLTAVATSLPELFTTVFSQEDHQGKITIGNIIGSNVYNLLLVGGVVSLFSTTPSIPLKDWLWLLLTTVGFVIILRRYSGSKPPRVVGIILFATFVAYLFSQNL